MDNDATQQAEVRRSRRSTGETLLTMFADTVRRCPRNRAVSDDQVCLTYHELDVRSTELARRFVTAGIRAEDRVAICLRRGVGVMVAILGVLKAGGAYVAVDPRYPTARRDLMISESGAGTVLTEPGQAFAASAVGGDVAFWEWTDDAAAAGDGSSSDLDGDAPDPVGPHNAACVLFTSGSSGTPKAVVLEHAGLVAFARNRIFADLTAADRVAHVSSLSFDAFHFELWCSLAVGAELVVLPVLADVLGTDVRRELRRRRISALLVPTMALNHLVREDRDTFDAVRLLYTGGDVLNRQTCVDLVAGDFAGRFVNLYGPTEATTACTGYEIRDIGPPDAGVPIGAALDGCWVTVRRADLSLAVPGEAGELHIGGIGVARGYLGRPGATADRFRPDPDGPPGSRMYATGDLGRLSADGLLEFRGRLDDQVKIRGFRVESGEVERAIGQHPDVAENAVLVAGHGDDRYLTLFVVPASSLSPTQVRTYASDVLPEHMVPSVILIVDSIPVNEHGKRDREQLAEWLDEHRRRADNYVEAGTDAERYLAKLWGELLAVEQVGAADDFFELGGHSLLAFRAQRRIRRDLGVDLDLAEVLDNSGLRDLARLIAGRQDVPA